MMHLRWFRATTAGAPFVYIQAYSIEAAREEVRANHYLYHSAKWIEVRACGWQEAMQQMKKGEE